MTWPQAHNPKDQQQLELAIVELRGRIIDNDLAQHRGHTDAYRKETAAALEETRATIRRLCPSANLGTMLEPANMDEHEIDDTCSRQATHGRTGEVLLRNCGMWVPESVAEKSCATFWFAEQRAKLEAMRAK